MILTLGAGNVSQLGALVLKPARACCRQSDRLTAGPKAILPDRIGPAKAVPIQHSLTQALPDPA